MSQPAKAYTGPRPESSSASGPDLPAVFVGKSRLYMTRLVLNGLGQTACTLATAYLVQVAFDTFIAAGTSGAASPVASGLLGLGLGFVACAAVLAWLRRAERVDAERLGQDYVHRVRRRAYRHLTALSPRALQRRSRGGLMLRFVTDLSALRRWVSLGQARLAVAGLTTGLTLGALAWVNPVLALTVVLTLGLGGASVALFGTKLREAVREARNRRAKLAADIDDRIASMAVVQVFGQTRRERRRVARQSQRLKEAMIERAGVIGWVRAFTEGVAAFSSAAVVLLGVYEVNAGRATPGTVVAAMSIVGLLVPALRDLGRVFEYHRAAQVSRAKLRSFLATPTLIHELPDAPALAPGPGRLTFERVSLEGVLHEVSATVAPGRVVAITGSNGAGKSTLLALAARFIDPSEGRIFIGDQDIAAHSLASLRRTVSMVSPDLPLLRGSVARNLRYRDPRASDASLAWVRDLCQLEDVLAALPRGENTKIRDGGRNLSTGQRQRLALARAILGQPRLLLLDEADANLDPGATGVLERVIETLRGTTTILYVTHDYARLAQADAVWRMEAGRLSRVHEPKERHLVL